MSTFLMGMRWLVGFEDPLALAAEFAAANAALLFRYRWWS